MTYIGVNETPDERHYPRSTKPGGRPSAIGFALTCVLALAPSLSLAEQANAAETAIMPPVSPACVSSPFGPRSLSGRPLAGIFHNGIDIAAPVGARVNAVAPGSIIRIQRHGVGGLEMLIQHQGFIGVYSHLGLIAPVIAEGRKAVLGGEKSRLSAAPVLPTVLIYTSG